MTLGWVAFASLPAGFAGGGASQAGALDHGRGDTAAAQEIGDRGADNAAAADDDSHHRVCALITMR